MAEDNPSRKKQKKISPVSIIFKVILVILLIINIIVICMGTALGAASVGKLPYSVIPILSDSMSPEIKSGDAVMVKQEDYDNIVPGDIVVYAKDGELIIHQVIGKNDDQFIAKGLDNSSEDLPIPKENYRAKFVFRVPLLGGIWRITGNPVRFVLLALLIGLIIFGDQIFSAIYIKVFDKENGETSEKNNNVDKE